MWNVIILKIIGIMIVILVFLLMILIFTKLKIDCTYKFEPKEQWATIQIKALFGLFRYRIKIPSEKINRQKQADHGDKGMNGMVQETDNEDGLSSLAPIKQLLPHLQELYKILKSFLKKLQIIQFEWKSAIGTGDAASSAIACGAGWTLKGNVIGVISHYFTLKVYPDMQITPVFNHIASQTYLRCMIQIRIGHAILAGMKLLKYWRQVSEAYADYKTMQTESKREDQSI